MTFLNQLEIEENSDNWREAQGKIQLVPSAGKHTTGVKRGKTQPVPSAEKQRKNTTVVKRGKTCNRCQARGNMQPVLSRGC